MSEKITQVDSQFANGYLFGEILYRYNQIVDFDVNFVNSSTKTAVVRNFVKVFAILTTMKVSFDSNVALAIINQEPGRAVLLLRSLKNHLDKTKGLVDYHIKQRTGTPNISFR